MRNKTAFFALKSRGVKGFCAHVAGRFFGDAHYLRPASTIDFKLREIQATHELSHFISNVLPAIQMDQIKAAIIEAEIFLENNHNPLKMGGAFPKHWDSGRGLQVAMFVMTRLIKPNNVLETGTANGASALAICGAMSKNGFGVLHSFDIRDSNAELVPENLREYLRLVRTSGTASELSRYISMNDVAGPNSIFLHDADHSYLGQISDFEIASESNFNYLVSDDVDTSLAFCDSFGGEAKIFFDAPKMIGSVNLVRVGRRFE